MTPIRILAVALLVAAALALEAAFLVGVVAVPLATALHDLEAAPAPPADAVEPAVQPSGTPARVAGQRSAVPLAGGPRAGRRAERPGR